MAKAKAVEFQTGCEGPFDPKSPDCRKECKSLNPEWHKACWNWWKTEGKEASRKEVAAKQEKKSNGNGKAGAGKTEWGHRRKTQAGIIDLVLQDGIAVKFDEFAEALGTSANRVKDHIQRHLPNDLEIPVEQADGYWWWAGADKPERLAKKELVKKVKELQK